MDSFEDSKTQSNNDALASEYEVKSLQKIDPLTTGLKLAVVFFILLVLASICGCAKIAAHDLLVSESPNLTDLLANAPQLRDDHARVVFYCPKEPLLKLELRINPPFYNTPVVTIEGDSGFLTKEIMDQTGFYLDVPTGVYVIEEKSGHILRKELNAGNEYFVKLFNDPKNPSAMVEPEQARQEIIKDQIKFPHLIMKCEHDVKLALIPKQNVQWKNTTSNLSDNTKSSYKSFLYFFNTKSGWVAPNVKFKVGVDCIPMFDVGNKSYVCFEVTPGRHVLCTSLINFGKEAFPPIGIELWAENGKNVYACYDWNKTRYRVLNETEGMKLLKKYKVTKNGYYEVAE